MVAAARSPLDDESTRASLMRRLWSHDLPREHGFEPLALEGTLPETLRGTLYRNGPGLFGQFGRRYSHPFESDGAITAIRLEGNRALGAARITASAGLLEERARGQLLYGMRAPWSRRIRNVLSGRLKNTANTNVLAWQGRLFALMEAARPTEIDPRDLTTIGETRLGGVLRSAFSAHPHRVAARGATYSYGLEYGRVTRLHTYELPDAGPARHLGSLALGAAPMVHDFIATETHLVFFVSPLHVDVPRMVLQVGSFSDLFRWRPERGTEVICVPIDHPDQPVRFTTAPFFQWHFASAFTRKGQLVVDYVRYENAESLHALGTLAAHGNASLGQLHRATIDLSRRTFHSELVHDMRCEFPSIAQGREGRQPRFAYLLLGELGAVGRLDLATGAALVHELPPMQQASEPIFVPRPGAQVEDDGWLLALCHDGPTSRAFLAVYEASRVDAGPIARAWFDHHVPITFHGTFVAATS